MNKARTTRSTKNEENLGVMAKSRQSASLNVLQKVFFVSERMLKDGEGVRELRLERFFHPGKGRQVLFVTNSNMEMMMEVLEFAEPRRSWLIDNSVCSNGSIYLTTPIDVTFLALPHLRKHCTKKAMSLDSIHDEQDPSVSRLMTCFVRPQLLGCVADVKTLGDGMKFFKYNHEKTIAWLALKTKAVAEALRRAKVHCGHSALSQNYVRGVDLADETAKHSDYLRMACDYVGGYITLDLHEDLMQYLRIPSELQAMAEERKMTNNKRQLDNKLDAMKSKKIKLEKDDVEKCENGASGTQHNTSSHDDNKSPLSTIRKSLPLKERVLSAKEKSLAVGAKGTKSIESFFKKTV